MRRFSPLALLLAVALAVVSTSCGGDDASTVGAATTVEESTNERSKDEDTMDGDLSGALVDDDCRALAAAWVSFVFAVVFPSGSPEQASALQRLADTVPAELEADVLTMAKGYRKFADNLADPDLDPDFDLVAGLAPRLAAGEIPSDEQIQAALAQMHAALRQSQTALAPYDAATKASGRVSTWVKENCTG